MKFEIASIPYLVRRLWSLALDGDRVDGYAAANSRTIYLDGDLDEIGVLATLREEHAHAWEFELGEPTFMRDRARYIALIGSSFEQQFADQGGSAALAAIPIEGNRPTKRPPIQSREMRYSDRASCGACGAEVMCGSIFSGPLDQLEESGITVISRGFECPVCGRVQRWRERATKDGLPSGEYIDASLLSGAEAEAWLAKHRVHAPYNLY